MTESFPTLSCFEVCILHTRKYDTGFYLRVYRQASLVPALRVCFLEMWTLQYDLKVVSSTVLLFSVNSVGSAIKRPFTLSLCFIHNSVLDNHSYSVKAQEESQLVGQYGPVPLRGLSQPFALPPRT